MSNRIIALMPCAAVIFFSALSPGFAAGVIVHPSTISGVDLVGPDRPEFASSMQKAFPTAVELAALSPVVPMSTIIVNTGSRSVMYYALRFDYVDATGKRTSGTSIVDRRTARSPIKPGDALFDAAVPGWRTLIAKQPNPSALTAFSNAQRRYSQDSVAISLDAIVFDDGEFVGPDAGNQYMQITAGTLARQALFRDMAVLSGASDAEIAAKLAGVLAEPLPAPVPPLLEDPSAAMRRRSAIELRLALRLSREKFNSLVSSSSLAVYRRGKE